MLALLRICGLEVKRKSTPSTPKGVLEYIYTYINGCMSGIHLKVETLGVTVQKKFPELERRLFYNRKITS